jgi:hypothetical protein
MKPLKPESHQQIETIGFLTAVVVVALYGLVEVGIHAGLLHPVCKTGIPWVMLMMVGALVLPKTLGRATAGDIWRLGIKAMWRPRGSLEIPQPDEEPKEDK